MMKKKLILSFFFVALGFGVVKAQDLPDKKETLKTVTKVNDYFMKKYADYRTPSFVKNVTRPSNIWTRGVYYEGLMALYSVYPRDDYYKYAVDWSNYHEWGFRNGTTTRNADDYCASQTYIDLYNICPDPERIRKVKANIDMLVNTPQVNDWWWIDAIQMGMPVFAKLGKLTGEQKYFDKMWDMYEYTRNKHGENGMYNQKEGLWWRDQDFDPPYKEPNGKNCYWSRGNGWVYAALVRVLNEIPTDEKHRADYINDFLTMSKAIKNCQRTDGFWNVSMHDESNFGGKETSGTALFVYGMAWGVPFDVDYITWKIVDKKVAKRTAVQEQIILPLRAQNYATLVPGKKSERTVFTMAKFTIPDDKCLVVELNEKNGGRHQSFVIENEDLVRANTINELQVR